MVTETSLKDIDAQCANFCARKTAQPSVLCLPSDQLQSSVEFRWEDILIEMKEHAPDVSDFMVGMVVPKVKGNDGRVKSSLWLQLIAY